jgi:hypothetical protein
MPPRNTSTFFAPVLTICALDRNKYPQSDEIKIARFGAGAEFRYIPYDRQICPNKSNRCLSRVKPVVFRGCIQKGAKADLLIPLAT